MDRIVFFGLLCLIQFNLIGQITNPFDIVRDSSHIEESSTAAMGIDADESESVVPEQSAEVNPFEVDTFRQEIKNTPVFRPINDAAKKQSIDNTENDFFIFVLVILCLILITFSITRDRKAFSNLLKLITNRNYLKLVNRDITIGKLIFYILLYAVFCICIAIFIYKFVTLSYSITNRLSLYIMIFVIVTGIYLIRHFSLFLLSMVLLPSQLIKDYNFLIIVSNVICGLLLFPIVILICYSPFADKLIFVGIGLIGICYLLRQGNGMMSVLAEKQANLFHFFIYICTFEIAPALIIIKLVQEYMARM